MSSGCTWGFVIVKDNSVVAFFLFILTAVTVYWYGVLGINNLVKRFSMSIPNKSTTMLHVQNLSCFLCLALVAIVSQVFMVAMYSG